MSEFVTIKSDELAQLRADAAFLQRLRGAGVDNWEGFEFALEDEEDDPHA